MLVRVFKLVLRKKSENQNLQNFRINRMRSVYA